MRKVVVGVFVSLDGVMQAPGGPQEDPTGGFRFGGWVFPHSDDVTGAAVGALFEKPFDLLLGRRTYDIFAAYWPYIETDPAGANYSPGNAQIARLFNGATKHVATHRPESLSWETSTALGADVVAAVAALKKTDGPDLLVQGSGDLIRQLLTADVVDVIQLLIFPVLLGRGKRLFDGGAAPTALKLVNSQTSGTGVILARYERGGEVPTGSFVTQPPSAAELERRRRLDEAASERR